MARPIRWRRRHSWWVKRCIFTPTSSRCLRPRDVTAREAKSILEVIARRVASRRPAAYLVNKIYMRGLPFYVDERVIVPRSFIGELLDFAFQRRG